MSDIHSFSKEQYVIAKDKGSLLIHITVRNPITMSAYGMSGPMDHLTAKENLLNLMRSLEAVTE